LCEKPDPERVAARSNPLLRPDASRRRQAYRFELARDVEHRHRAAEVVDQENDAEELAALRRRVRRGADGYGMLKLRM
jgi:hypothetical protein